MVLGSVGKANNSARIAECEPRTAELPTGSFADYNMPRRGSENPKTQKAGRS